MKKVIVFANSIWFLEKFKYYLISQLSIENKVECLYLRPGPDYDKKKINSLRMRNVDFYKVDTKYVIVKFLKKLIPLNLIKEEEEIKNILVFTIGPILLTSVIFRKNLSKVIIILEGLGRVFSSRLITYRILKRVIQVAYKNIFSKSKYVLTLNYSDATYLAELKIAPISKINIIPGTGVDIKTLRNASKQLSQSPKYIDFMARTLPEKGFYDFLYMRKYLIRHNKDIAKNYLFRIITPKSDIDSFTVKDKKFFSDNGIIIKSYLDKPYEYYKDSKVIVISTRYGEGLSRVVLEAVYLGIPLLVSRNQGTEEVLPLDYKYFTISKNPSVLVGQLLKLIEESSDIKEKLIKQRVIIENYYSTNKSIQTLEKFLD